MGKKFPTISVIMLVIGILWLLTEIDIIKIDVPWIPVILIIISLGWIINHYTKDSISFFNFF